MKVILLSTYDLGHQPFALASLAASLSAKGAEVICNDLAVEPLNESALKTARLIAVHLAMHTATRLALELLPRVKSVNQNAHICFFGLYAPMTEEILKTEKNITFIGGEFEPSISSLYTQLKKANWTEENGRVTNHLKKHSFEIPVRTSLPPLESYAYLKEPSGDAKIVGYTEASRGCKHVCRHCPVVPIYGGRFFVVPVEIVMKDIRQLVKAGAQHISFGDPDFFNGPKHAINIVTALNDEFPNLGYDVIIKVEHLLKHKNLLSCLTKTGCRFITTAVETLDDRILKKLEKGHTSNDFKEVASVTKHLGLTLAPTFIPFTPWSTTSDYIKLLKIIAELELIDNVASVQLTIRLLIPLRSRLLELKEIREKAPNFDPEALGYSWRYSDLNMEILFDNVSLIVAEGEKSGATRRQMFMRIWEVAHNLNNIPIKSSDKPNIPEKKIKIPTMSEAWYCCAEPTHFQVKQI